MTEQLALQLGVRTWGSLKPGDRVRYEGRLWEVQDPITRPHCDRCDLIGIYLVAVGESTHGTVIRVHANEEA